MKNNIFTRIMAIALIAMSIVTISIPAMAETGLAVGTKAYTIKGDVAVRKSASTKGKIISRVDTGTEVTILDTTNTINGWYRVRVDGLTSNGYIREDCLGATEPEITDTHTTIPVNANMYCNVTSGQYVNIRSGPSKNQSSIGKLHRGDTVYVVSKSGNWARISYPKTGYVMLTYLQNSPVN